MLKETQISDINEIIAIIKGDEVALHWAQKDFEDAATSPNRICYHAPNIGFIILQTVLDEAEIMMIWVSPPMRSQGKGRQILIEAINNLKQKGFTNLFLEVADNNINAIKMYNHAGFIEIGHRKDYYKDINSGMIDAITMKLDI